MRPFDLDYYSSTDSIVTAREEETVNQAIRECDVEQLVDALANPRETDEDLAAIIHSQILGHEMVDSIRGIIDALPSNNRKHLVIAMTNVIVPLLDALAKEKEEKRKDEFEATARHGFLNYEQAALHKMAQAFGGKNKHPANIASMQHAYAQLGDAVNSIRSEMNKRDRNAKRASGKRTPSSSSVRDNNFNKRMKRARIASTIVPSAHDLARDHAIMRRKGAYSLGDHSHGHSPRKPKRNRNAG